MMCHNLVCNVPEPEALTSSASSTSPKQSRASARVPHPLPPFQPHARCWTWHWLLTGSPGTPTSPRWPTRPWKRASTKKSIFLAALEQQIEGTSCSKAGAGKYYCERLSVRCYGPSKCRELGRVQHGLVRLCSLMPPPLNGGTEEEREGAPHLIPAILPPRAVVVALFHATQQGASRAVSVPPTQRCSQIRLWVPQPISYPGSPWSWGSLWAIWSSASLKFTQREMQAF